MLSILHGQVGLAKKNYKRRKSNGETICVYHFNCFFLEISILAIKNIGHDQSGRVSEKGPS